MAHGLLTPSLAALAAQVLDRTFITFYDFDTETGKSFECMQARATAHHDCTTGRTCHPCVRRFSNLYPTRR